MASETDEFLALLASGAPPREKARVAADALRRAPNDDDVAAAILSHLAGLRPLAPRRGEEARPFLAMIAAAAASGRGELASALGFAFAGLVEPISADGPAAPFLLRPEIGRLSSREALRRVGAAIGPGGLHETLRRRYAALHPYWRDPKTPGPNGARALILNRLPNFFETDEHFVHNQSNLPHAYAELGASDDLALDVFFLVGSDFDAAKAGIARPDVVYNNVASAEIIEREGHAAAMRAIAAHFDVPLINAPEQHVKLTRSRNFEWIGERERFFFPTTLRFAPGFSVLEAADAVSASVGRRAIIRDLYGHMGAAATLASSRGEVEAALRGLAANGAYAIAYHDLPQWNGLYCRYRIFKIGDEVFASRIHFAEGWNVHGDEHDALKAARPDLGLGDLEIRFWEEPTSLVPEATWTALGDLLRETGADVVGCDFTLTPDGRALIFEVNGSMHVPVKGRAAFERLCGLRQQED